MSQSDGSPRFLLPGLGAGAVFTALLALIFGGRLLTQNAGGKHDAKPTTDATEPIADPKLPKADAGYPFLSPVYDYLGKANPINADSLPGFVALLKAQDVDLQCLIMTVPDVVRSPFGDRYDQYLEAVQKAHATAGGYITETRMVWLPWEKGRVRPGGEGQPGFVLFRRGGRDGKATGLTLRALLLVPETPNAGVDQRAMGKAFDVVAALTKPQSRTEYRLLAPCFSGTQPSLAIAVRSRWKAHAEKPGGQPPRFYLLSGSSNGLRPFDEVWPDGSMPPELAGNARDLVLKSTLVPSAVQEAAMLHYLARRADSKPGDPLTDRPDRVAKLVEFNSGFGANRTESIKQNRQEQPDEKKVWVFGYPMHASRVLDEYGQYKQELNAKLVPGGTIAGPRAETDERKRTFPAADPVRSAEATQGLLGDFYAVIRREGVRHVGILASSTPDKIHLSGLVKENCPDVQPFVTGNDVLFAHPNYQHIMRGVLVASTYPLYPPNQGWTDPTAETRIPFQSQSAQGIYNAALIHLGRRDQLLDYGPPALDEYQRRGPSKPAVWITTTGEAGRFLPLQYFVNYEPSARHAGTQDEHNIVYNAAEQDPFDQSPVPPLPAGSAVALTTLPTIRFFRVLALLVIPVVGFGLWKLLFSGSPWVLWKPRHRPPTSDPEPTGLVCRLGRWLVKPMGVDEGRTSVFVNLGLAAIIVMLSAMLLVAVAMLRSWYAWPWPKEVCLWTIASLLSAELVLAAGLQVRLLGRYFFAAIPVPGPHEKTAADKASMTPAAKRMRAVVNVLFAAATALFVGSAAASAVWGDGSNQVLFLERVLALPNGYSLLLPLVFLTAGLLVYAQAGLKRDHLADQFEVECPYPAPGRLADDQPVVREACREIRDDAEHIHKDLTDPAAFLPATWWGGVLTALTAVVVGGYAWSRVARTWEGRAWDVTFFVGFLGLGLLVVASVVRFWSAWKKLEQLLANIALVPMVRAFDRLPEKVTALFGGYLYGGRPRRSHLAIAMHLLRQVEYEAGEARRAAHLEPVLAGNGRENGHRPAVRRAAMPALEQAAVAIECDVQLVPFDLETLRLLEKPAQWELLSVNPAALRKAADTADAFPGEEARRLSWASCAVVENLSRYWPRHTVADAFGDRPGGDGKPADGSAAPVWVDRAEQFVAVQVVIFLSQFFAQLHRLARTAVACALLLLLAATCYPFQPEVYIMYALIGLTTVVGGAVLWVLYRMNKNEMVSRITRSTPNRFEFTSLFMGNTAQLVLPLVLIAAAQLSGRLRTVLEPFLVMVR